MVNRKYLTVFLIAVGMIVLTASNVGATACSDAGDFEGVCTSLSGLFNATMALISIVATGSNASIIITAAVILAIVTFFVDMARGEKSWLRAKMRNL